MYRKESTYFYHNPDGSFHSGQINRVEVLENGREMSAPPKTLDAEDIDGILSGLNADLLSQRDSLTKQVDKLSSDLAERDGTIKNLVDERDKLAIDKESLREQLIASTTTRNELTQKLLTAESELAAAQATVTLHAERIATLEAELESIQNPPVNPRHLAPFDFLALLKPAEIYALQTSTDPTVVVGRAKLQTIITFVDLDHPETIGLVRYMEAAGLAEPGRADEILSGVPPAA